LAGVPHPSDSGNIVVCGPNHRLRSGSGLTVADGVRRLTRRPGNSVDQALRAAVEEIVDSSAASSATPSAKTVCIDLDRFCGGCGYNLRTQQVVRDATTGIPVVRCPECGTFQSANDAATALRPWLRRLTALGLVLWILALGSVVFWLGMAQGAISYGTLDELTTYGTYTTQRINNTTIRTWTGSGPLRIDTEYPDYWLFITAILALSFATAFACGAFIAVTCPHWPRVAYWGLVLGMPLVAGAFVAVGWHYEAPHLFTWSQRYLASHAAMQMLGGLLGVAWGRPLARLTVRITLPPGLRPRLAYLWAADGKSLPR
jgi:hypothetical protein